MTNIPVDTITFENVAMRLVERTNRESTLHGDYLGPLAILAVALAINNLADVLKNKT
jgi:hypothetical protein